MMRRIVLFLVTNLAVLLLLGIVLNLLGLGRIQTGAGTLDYRVLLAFAAVFGMGGAFISLVLSKWMAKTSMGVHVIDHARGPAEEWLLTTVRRLSSQAGIAMPEVGIFPSPALNAFATGMNKNAALVAVSEGLLAAMDRDEIEAVLGHEISHVANGDMVTLALIQGVVNTFVIFLARVIGSIVDRALSREGERGYGIGYYLTVFIAELFLGLFASMIVMAFSRWREFRADAGGANLAGRGKMIAALRRLQAVHEPHDLPGQYSAFGINGGIGGGLRRLLLSHPPLAERIAVLESRAR